VTATRRPKRRSTGPLHPRDKFLLARDTEEEANRERDIHAQTLVIGGLATEWGVYVRPTVIEVTRGKGRSPAVRQRVFGLYVGRHDRAPT
jgi:hypothetical protein